MFIPSGYYKSSTGGLYKSTVTIFIDEFLYYNSSIDDWILVPDSVNRDKLYSRLEEISRDDMENELDKKRMVYELRK